MLQSQGLSDLNFPISSTHSSIPLLWQMQHQNPCQQPNFVFSASAWKYITWYILGGIPCHFWVLSPPSHRPGVLVATANIYEELTEQEPPALHCEAAALSQCSFKKCCSPIKWCWQMRSEDIYQPTVTKSYWSSSIAVQRCGSHLNSNTHSACSK